jgi:hypothetical protein
MMSHVARAGLLAIACSMLPMEAATARTPYDGSWTVLIVTQRGVCDRAYRYGIEIVDGFVRYDGGMVNLTGRVTGKGNVRVTVAAAGSRADGTGKLSRTAGRGNWAGRSGNDICSGYWTAERR